MSDNLEKNISDAMNADHSDWCSVPEKYEQDDDWYDTQELMVGEERDINAEIYMTNLITAMLKNTNGSENQTHIPTDVSLGDIPWHNVTQHDISWQDVPHGDKSVCDEQHLDTLCSDAQTCDKQQLNNNVPFDDEEQIPFFSHTSMLKKITNPYFMHKISTLTVASLVVYAFVNGNSRTVK